jgi:predicted Zn-dependent peptidase
MSRHSSSIQTRTFPNGLILVYENPSNTLPITSINAFCRFGSARESDDFRGAAHFIEHMCFKGTTKIPRAKDIFLKYDRIGAMFNAYTNKQTTCYTVKCENDYIENCIQIVSDMMMNSVFKKSEFVKEHDVVIEENIRDSDDSSDIISNMMEKHIYAGSSFEQPIDDIKYHTGDKLKHEDVVKMYKKYYHPNNVVFSIVSNVSFSKIIKAVESSYFLKNKINPKCSLASSIIPPLNVSYTPQSQIQYDLFKKTGESTLHLMIGFRTCSQFSDDKYCLNILKNILGGSLSSRLFMILREQNGLTYTSSATTTFYENMGDFSIYAETDYNKIIKNGKTGKGVLPLIVGLLHDLIKSGITQTELTDAKHNLKGKMLLELEDIDTQADHNGTEILLYDKHIDDKIIPYREMYATYYKNVTRTQINDVIKKYFKPENMTACIVGSHIPELKIIQSECEKIRSN